MFAPGFINSCRLFQKSLPLVSIKLANHFKKSADGDDFAISLPQIHHTLVAGKLSACLSLLFSGLVW